MAMPGLTNRGAGLVRSVWLEDGSLLAFIAGTAPAERVPHVLLRDPTGAWGEGWIPLAKPAQSESQGWLTDIPSPTTFDGRSVQIIAAGADLDTPEPYRVLFICTYTHEPGPHPGRSKLLRRFDPWIEFGGPGSRALALVPPIG